MVAVVVDGDQEDGAGEDEQQQHRAAQTCKPPYRTGGPDLAWGRQPIISFPSKTRLHSSGVIACREEDHKVMSYTGALAWINSLMLCSVVTLCNVMELGSFARTALSPPTVGAKLIARCFMHHEKERP